MPTTPATAETDSVPMAKQAFYETKRFRQNIPLFLMLVPGILYYVIFRYLPMGGLVIAFKDYNFRDGILSSPWVGLKYFKILFQSDATLQIIWNTLELSILNLIFGFPAPIIIAIALNEVRKRWLKRWIQTIIYLPHFLSWVIVAGLVLTLFSIDGGTVNKLLEQWGMEPVPFLYRIESWVAIFIGSGMWKEMGFGAIIYLAALSSIDPSLYESTALDGAGKLRQIWHITLPGLRPTIILLLILGMGRLMEVGFDQVYNLQNPTVLEKAEVISTYVYKVGLQKAQFSLTTAMGLFESIVGLVLLLSANALARKFDQGLF
ncbi:ABC transporter permease subunit [Virgibacillus sp. LDC1]|uniref:ABC transporter permease n=1 Tax=Paenibacillus TaxID=44249 RepID=UPI000C27755A|nr:MULTISPECIES: ABC transporter permease subunit [Paenibacillus]MCV4233728.1 ABC transporter permease subunit [Virgibacillus sp. LDC1]MDL1161107.1 ABC transporter permease subunit [Yersinia pestis]MBX4151463.1 ABC transporter permease subunit [Paenibacillus lautus]MEC0254502.1 ABC transporter permease subunit [Paenibacillus lautus]PJN51334.1 putative multiple-sugar transport system permease YteP [Paenibacillus sp. GM2FR]